MLQKSFQRTRILLCGLALKKTVQPAASNAMATLVSPVGLTQTSVALVGSDSYYVRRRIEVCAYPKSLFHEPTYFRFPFEVSP